MPAVAAGKMPLASAALSRLIDRYGDLQYLPELAAKALARSQEMRRKSAADDQAKIQP